MTRIFVSIFFVTIIYLPLQSQRCSCDSILLQTIKIVENNYAGWFDKITISNKNEYKDWTEKNFRLSQQITSDSACAKTLQNWITYFHDKHLRVKFIQPQNQNIDKASHTSINILSSNLSEKQINDYFAKNKKIDPIEGIYISSSYKLAITKFKKDIFYATILTTSNENWRPGEVKLIIQKNKRY